ncbi:unnamed protein product [Linum tenue]|uniref:Serpin domain-containing protein n=1 Tax=Linum tenue TaxID=586396 RepID=A0AAV0QRJ4_9ROSI|nr:unnamed protein product [Linum tenue]
MELQTADVAMVLTKQVLLTEARDHNAVISPASIHAVLSLIAAGSSGPTREQLLSFLNANSIGQLNFHAFQVASALADGGAGGGPTLSFVNGAWVDKSLSLRHSFKQVAGSFYKAVPLEVDFKYRASEVAAKVNEWAEKHTNGLIKNVLPPDGVDGSTRLVFGNALYFKGAWASAFHPSDTKDHDFRLMNGSSVRVPFMAGNWSTKMQLVSQHFGFKVLSLPYKQGLDKRRFCMHIFLPDFTHGLPALIQRAGFEPGFLARYVPRKRVKVGELRIPKLKLRTEMEASRALIGLGLVLPFSGVEADFSEMVEHSLDDDERLHVSSIFHKSFIEVNEKGTEAAAAAIAAMQPICEVDEDEDRFQGIDFVADHPFLFVIQESMSGMVLFTGHIVDPSQCELDRADYTGFYGGFDDEFF